MLFFVVLELNLVRFVNRIIHIVDAFRFMNTLSLKGPMTQHLGVVTNFSLPKRRFWLHHGNSRFVISSLLMKMREVSNVVRSLSLGFFFI